MTDSNVTKLGKLPEGALDEYYIDAYLDKPANKKEAYLTAYSQFLSDCDDQGIEPYRINEKYAYQYAKSIHDRLRDRINAELYKLAEEDKALGRRVLRKLAEKAESESVQAQCASNLAKGLYPDVQITKQESIEDIDKQLKAVEQEIQKTTGTAIH